MASNFRVTFPHWYALSYRGIFELLLKYLEMSIGCKYTVEYCLAKVLKRNVNSNKILFDCCLNQGAFLTLNELRQSKSKTRVNTLHVELECPLGFEAFMFIAKDE